MTGIFLGFIFLFSCSAFAGELNVKQVTMIQTLDQIAGLFSQDYAPFEYKAHSEKLDLAAEFKNVQKIIAENPDINETRFQDLLFDVIHATRDFHVSMQVYSTEEATLPFQVMSAEDRYFVIYIDRTKIPMNSLPGFDIGTEVVEFGGKPPTEAVHELVPQRYKEPTPTELRIAELQLTSRSRAVGLHVPQGDIVVKVKTPDGKVQDFSFVWKYTPELIPADIPVRNMIFSNGQSPPRLDSPYTTGGPSMVPKLGTVLSELTGTYTGGYIFRLPKGHVVGYLRIPTFKIDKEDEAAEEFGKLVTALEAKTDGLVIDVTHNPGGSIAYMYSLLSRLTDFPLATLPQQIMVSSEMASSSAQHLTNLAFAQSDDDAKRAFGGGSFLGLPGNFQTLQSVLNFDRFLISELRAGRRLTNPTAFYGISRISPHPTQRYTRPLLVLVDELDFSGGDFFPAILQDNHRATIFGARTAGAGGAVKETQIPNQFNIKSLQYTWTIAQRLDGSPLENVGVTPDVAYTPSVKDLTANFVEYKSAVVQALETLIDKAAK